MLEEPFDSLPTPVLGQSGALGRQGGQGEKEAYSSLCFFVPLCLCGGLFGFASETTTVRASPSASIRLTPDFFPSLRKEGSLGKTISTKSAI